MKDIRVKTAITLCHIIEGYENFIKDIELIWEKNNYFYFIEDLKKASFKENIFDKREAKKFYENHDWIINTINEYSRIDIFLFEILGDKNKKQSMDALYKYLFKNAVNIEQILTLLTWIKTLGFQSILLDETADFTKEEYEILPIMNWNRTFVYLENLERIPSYGEEKIKYKSNGSHYKIKFDYSLTYKKFLMNRTIYLNSLLFDSSLLPLVFCDPDALFEEIVLLKEDKIEECKKIKDVIDVKLMLRDLKRDLHFAKQTIEELSNFAKQKDLKDALLYMELELTRMEHVGCEYDKEIIESNFAKEDILKRELDFRKNRSNDLKNLYT